MRLAPLFARISLAVCLTAPLFSAPLSAETMHEGASVSLPADQVQFLHSGIATDAGELMAGPAFGDMTKGHHGTFIQMPAGFVSPVHTHTEDYFGVVIRGTAANGLPDVGADVALEPGSYWFQRGEEAHVTKCLSDEDSLFFIYQPGAFDYLTAQ